MKPLSLPKTLVAIVAVLLIFCCLPVVSQAACAPPSSAGVSICQPSSNSTIFQVPHIEAAATPSSGSISSMKVFIDGKLQFQNSGGTVSLFDGGVSTGTHHLVVQATDDFGRTYQAAEYFGVTGNLPSSCLPSTVGVRICSPVQGQWVPNQFELAVGFKGATAITHVRAYVGSADVFDFTPAAGEEQLFAGALESPVGAHTLTVVAWDAQGHVYKSSVGFNAFYEAGCPPRGTTCNPGIYVTTPQDGDDVQSPFRVSAAVEFNPAPIVAMKVYVSGVRVAESSGPTLDQPISAAKGTHILVIQAWDTQNHLYKVTQNVNVQ